jgi:O-glycosyl hydrolase
MTEYSGMSWFKTARFIQQTLKYANTSAYIYWMLVWGNSETKDQAMIYVDASGNYTVNSFYYLIKHFSRFIDKGYKRIEVSVPHPQIEATAFMSPLKTQITIVAVNTDSFDKKYSFEVENAVISSVKAYQSVSGDYFRDLGTISADQLVKMPANSITTFVLSL